MSNLPEKVWLKESYDSWGSYGHWYSGNEGGGESYTRTDTITQWNPIETAPKDGTVILVWHETVLNQYAAFDVNIKKAQWLVEAEEWRVEGVGGNVPPNLTHWMPMPNKPRNIGDT